MSLGGENAREAIPGLPEHLPAGEYVCWQGAPDWKDLAIHGFHARKLAFYFALLLAARIIVQANGGAPTAEIMATTSLLGLLAVSVLGFIALYVWLAARAARYTLTNRRLVIRCGATLAMTINLPFEKIESADLRVRNSGHGDLPITLTRGDRPSWVILWPHVKPFSLGRVRPMLRSVPNAQEVGERVGTALRQYADGAPAEQPRVIREAPTALPPEMSPSAS